MKLGLNHRATRYVPVWLGILAILGLLVLSMWYETGYVLLIWLGWQVQTSMPLFLLLLLLLGSILSYVVKAVQQSWQRWRQQPQHLGNWQQLQPFEQLGCLWLLNAKTTRQADLQAVFDQSNQLKHIIRAHLYRENGQYELAWAALNQNSSLQDLVNLEKVQLWLAEQHYAPAFELLQQLSQQQPSVFIRSLVIVWQHVLQDLWATLATHQPWLILTARPLPALNVLQQLDWLTALARDFKQSSPEQQLQLLAFYDSQQQPDILSNPAIAQQWLFLLSQMPDDLNHTIGLDANNSLDIKQNDADSTSATSHIDLLTRRQMLADPLIRLHFDPKVLNIWLHNQMKQDTLDCRYFAQRLEELAQRYPGQPSIALAQYHQWLASGQVEKAEAILQHWHQHADFSYLRLTQALAGRPELLADLDILHNHRMLMKD